MLTSANMEYTDPDYHLHHWNVDNVKLEFKTGEQTHQDQKLDIRNHICIILINELIICNVFSEGSYVITEDNRLSVLQRGVRNTF